ncbi:uncharacterized protein LOC101460921 isoform X2 [Ceratitis capitata]|uniref:(Mediterranean fruit fly) hypothetical protein n=2 Tax=Ceratitis capitata TaxID=7213 RepID=A0A811UID9_CERCA|nr:uncharacterized protein LOC101460921 isoform X2 [Ceratitis capitata]CAD6998480.1 unnamed protein product [Ceratitis capitata]
MRTMCTVVLCSILMMVIASIESRPQSVLDNDQDLRNFGQEIDESRNSYYEVPVTASFSAVPLDRLQMLIAQYRPTSYGRTPGWNPGMNELFRMPESKRQVRYRQCYFNPISCFKK